MKLTGPQIEALADFADGADCTVAKVHGQDTILVTRLEDEDGFYVKIYTDGSTRSTKPPS
jgi:hypothetical protein